MLMSSSKQLKAPEGVDLGDASTQLTDAILVMEEKIQELQGDQED